MVATYTLGIDWDEDGDYGDTGEQVWNRLRDGTISVQYGRDQGRSLSGGTTGQASWVLDNASGDYSPENTSSPLVDVLQPGKPILLQAELSAVTYTLFRGHINDYQLTPGLAARTVSFTDTDALQRLREINISTSLHQGLRTGDAIHTVLDAAGWDGGRDIDSGATLVKFWWENDITAMGAIDKLVASEGPPAVAFVGPDGEFVFRDRHHRVTRAASTSSQATFRDAGGEVRYAHPLGYDHGWRDVISSATFQITERMPAGEYAVVWDNGGTVISLTDGETRLVNAFSGDPFVAALVPVQDVDYVLASGTVQISLLRDSGPSVGIRLKATGGPAVITGLQLRAFPIIQAGTFQVSASDSSSQGKPLDGFDPAWAGVYDAQAVADLIVAQYAQRRPTITIRLVNGNDTQLAQQLARDISDRITVINAELGLSADFFIENIQHTVSANGQLHETIFTCEKVPAEVSPVFRFDTAGAGFDDGKFGSGLDDPSNMFRFDTAGQGFDDGVFAT